MQTALDEEAASRCTSVYLVQRVIPMLPHLLCQELCSLNPGVDRLAFSAVWDMTPEGNIESQWLGRTVIRCGPPYMTPLHPRYIPRHEAVPRSPVSNVRCGYGNFYSRSTSEQQHY